MIPSLGKDGKDPSLGKDGKKKKKEGLPCRQKAR